MAAKGKGGATKETWSYVERDVSWMYFNRRILVEAQRLEVPLLERLGFLGIYSNNLDEFFRVRVATLERIEELKSGRGVEAAKREASQTLKTIYKLNKQYSAEFDDTYSSIVQELESEGIHIVNDEELTEVQQQFVEQYYLDELNGATNPLLLNKLTKLGEMDDSAIYLAVQMDYEAKYKGEKVMRRDFSVIGIPYGGSRRFVRLPDVDGEAYIIFIDDIIRFCLPRIFAGTKYVSFSAYTFKFTKDAEMEVDSELSASLMQRISKGIRSRKRGEALRFVYDERMPKDLMLRLKKKLNMDKRDSIMPGRRYHNMKDLMGFPNCGKQHLKYAKLPPLLMNELSESESAISAVRKRDWLIHCPYHSFDMFIRLLREAALQPHVRSISISIYRLARHSKVIQALLAASRNGKKVTVMIELMARFDEASNLDWSRVMQEAGIRVIFGPEGLKVHSKLLHIGSTQGNIACVSTGNFHEGNARIYTDYILMTAKRPIVNEVERAFEFIERPYIAQNFKELVVAPNDMRKWFNHYLNKEVSNVQRGKPAYLIAKVNHVTDPQVVERIYQAAAAGVRIELLVRGNCSLCTDDPRLNDNLRVVGIIDRFLEHSRIFIFCNGGAPRAFIGSADLMPRNLDTRIEVLCPVYDPALIADLERTIEYGMRDSSQGRLVDGRGTKNLVPLPDGGEPFRSQTALYEAYKQDLANAEEA